MTNFFSKLTPKLDKRVPKSEEDEERPNARESEKTLAAEESPRWQETKGLKDLEEGNGRLRLS